MNILIAYLLGLLTGGSGSNNGINVSAVGCNPIVQAAIHEKFVSFVQFMGILFAFWAACILLLIFLDSAVRNYRLMKRGY